MTQERTCVACGRKCEKTALSRFVWKEQRPLRDETGSAHGRGAYCCRNQECEERFMAQKKKWKRVFRL